MDMARLFHAGHTTVQLGWVEARSYCSLLACWQRLMGHTPTWAPAHAHGLAMTWLHSWFSWLW
jgi:hypothetical protein